LLNPKDLNLNIQIHVCSSNMTFLLNNFPDIYDKEKSCRQYSVNALCGQLPIDINYIDD